MKIIKKILGALLLSTPFWLASWFLSEIVYQPFWTGVLMLLTGTLAIVAIVVVFLGMLVIMTIGQQLWKGEKIEWLVMDGHL